MIINPLFAIHGFTEIAIILDDDDAAEAMKIQAKKLLKERLMEYRPPATQEADDSEYKDAATGGKRDKSSWFFFVFSLLTSRCCSHCRRY